MHHPASIMASATPSASVPGTSPAAPEEGGLGGLCHHTAWPQGATRRAASNDHAFTRTNDTSCLPSSSVIILRKMLESCDSFARREQMQWANVLPPCGVATSGRRGDRSPSSRIIIQSGEIIDTSHFPRSGSRLSRASTRCSGPPAPLIKDGNKHTYIGHPLPDFYLQNRP
jgi:hypothetical protein